MHDDEPLAVAICERGTVVQALSLERVAPFHGMLGERHGLARRLCVFTRSAGDLPNKHRASCEAIFRAFDEFLMFERPECYDSPEALSRYERGSIGPLLHEQLSRLNAQSFSIKPIELLDEWAAVEKALAARLPEEGDSLLVLINQPTTSATDLNHRIVSFVTSLQQRA